MNMDKYSDKDIIEGMISGDEYLTKYFFFDKCAPMLGFIAKDVFKRKVKTYELIGELYLYLASNNWNKLRSFDYRSKLTTWLSVVAIRFFIKLRAKLIENESSQALIEKRSSTNEGVLDPSIFIDRKIDVQRALLKMKDKRSRMVIETLDLKDVRPEILANEMNVSVDYLYTIRHRAHKELRLIMEIKEVYNG